MNTYLLTVIAAACNVGTIICIKKCKFGVLNGLPVSVWMLGIAATILATQFLLLRADIKGASLGLVVSVVIASVMVAAAFIGLDEETGKLALTLKHLAPLEIAGYALAVLGVLLVGVSQQINSASPPTSESHRPVVLGTE